MQFIDKTQKSIEGHAIVSEFIHEQWIDDQYINLTYEDFISGNSRFTNLLVEEQNGYCCYCMRKLSILRESKNVTLEHVIPQSAKEFSGYEVYGELNPQNIFFWDASRRNEQFTPPPFPHSMSYENLVASCNGTLVENGNEIVKHHQCCNNRRENDPIIPIFFLQNAAEIINYASDGKIVCDEEFDKTIRTLNLEHDMLCLMRKTWCSISKIHSINDITAAIDNSELRSDILDDIDGLSTSQKQSLVLDTYWKLLAQFEWFHGYYSRIYAIA